MNDFEVCAFARRIGFGIAPDEAIPNNPVDWAIGQLDKAPAVAFYANRAGDRIAAMPATVRLLDSQADVCTALQQHNDSRRAMLAASNRLPPAEWEAMRYERVVLPYLQMTAWQETLARGAMAVNGPAPVFERFWHFWANHFTVAPSGNFPSHTAVGPYMRMLRSHMSGTFRDMLFEAVTHPAMVLYLDNARSTGANSSWRRSNRTRDEINENLGRELLELFTVTPAVGYSQEDVLGVTNILTGWGVQLQGNSRGSYFEYGRHEPGAQTVMGKSYSSIFRPDGKLNDLVDELAAHPATAQHIGRKMATAFVADDPPADCVARLVKVFTASKGNLPALHKAVVREVAQAASAYRRFFDPQTWLWMAYRVSGASLPATPPQRKVPGERLPSTLTELGQPLHDCPQPNGWPLQSREWISREMMDRRVRYAYQFSARIPDAAKSLPGILARQHGEQSALARELGAAASGGARNLWTAYLVSPEFLWGQA